MKITCIILVSACLSFGGEFKEIKNHSSDDRITNFIDKFDNENYILQLKRGRPEKVFMDTMIELMEAERIIKKIVVYMNVAPPVPDGYQGKDWLFSGVDPEKISDKDIRDKYINRILINEKIDYCLTKQLKFIIN